MKSFLQNFFLFLLPFLTLVLVNELSRLCLKNEPFYVKYGIKTINSNAPIDQKCTWHCHNNTNYCKQHHVKYFKPYFHQIDPIYFGIINQLQATGNYSFANVLILVILVPLLVFVFFIKSIKIQVKINKLKK